MKKFMRIALVFALAGATLVGCTKDYSGDISDLNKKVAEQQSAVTALQNAVSNAQTAADNALANAQNALKEAQAAAKAAADANNDAEVAALTAKVATIEGEIADLEAKVKALDGLEAKLNEVAEQLKKDVDAKVDAALEEIQAELEKAIAQVEGNFSIEAATEYTATYSVAKWNPSTKTKDKEIFDKVAEAFPEIAKIEKGTEVEIFGRLPFIVNPSTVELDDTYTFSLVNEKGKNSGIELGNPTLGYAVKAGSNVWNVEVQSYPHDVNGRPIKNRWTDKLALVAETATGITAQTGLAYQVYAYEASTNDKLSVTGYNKAPNVETESITVDAFDTDEGIFRVTSTNCQLYAFVIEAADEADVEDYGITIDGSLITFNNITSKDRVFVDFNLYAVGVNGSVSKTEGTYVLIKTVEPNAELADKEVTLGVKNGNYKQKVRYNKDDFGFTASEWRSICKNSYNNNNWEATLYAYDSDGYVVSGYDADLKFFDKNGDEVTNIYDDYAEVKSFGFDVDSRDITPGTWVVEIFDYTYMFYGVGELTVKNPEACPIKLAEALCDENGVLIIVGSTRDEDENVTNYVEYELENALVYKTGEAKVGNFHDVAYEDTEEGTAWTNVGGKFRIPAWNKPWNANEPNQKLLNTPHEFSVDFGWFTNDANKGTFEFKAKAVSPIWTADGANFTLNKDFVSTIYYTNDPATDANETETSLDGAVAKVKFVAGEHKGEEFEIKAGKSAVTFGWKDSDKKIPDITSNYVNTSYIATKKFEHTNLDEGFIYLRDADGNLIEFGLEESYKIGSYNFEHGYELYLERKADPDFKNYLQKSEWDKIVAEWAALFRYGFKYNGARVAKDVNTGLPEDHVKTLNEQAEAAYKALDSFAKARVDAFEALVNKVGYSGTIKERVAILKAPATPLTPTELASDPYFTCADPETYFAYVIFNGNNTGVNKDTHVTTIQAHATEAGMKTVEIPLTAHVKDTWGMTTEFTVKVTVKVK